MASIIQVGDKWRAQVRRKGHSAQTRTFATKALATRWATSLESEIDRGEFQDRRELATTTLADLFDRYRKETSYLGEGKAACLKTLEAKLGKEPISNITGERLVRYAKERKAQPATWGMEIGYLGGILKIARSLWKLPIVGDPVGDAKEAFKMLGINTKPKERSRRPTAKELTQLKDHFNKAERQILPMSDVIDFAIATAMRAGEIFSIRWDDINEAHKTIIIRDRKDPQRKKGNNQTVPLLPVAWEIVKRQPKTKDGRVFPFLAATVSSTFPRACKKLGIVDLRFHDLRHEGASRLFEMGYGIQEVAIFTGHRNWNQLRRYTQIKPESLHRLTPS